MAKNSTVRARIDDKLKADVEKILDRVGVSTSDAIALLMRQIVLHKGLPFDVRIPNAETQRAMRELDDGKGVVFKGSTADFMKKMLSDDK